MFKWSTKNKNKEKKQYKSNPTKSYTKVNDELLFDEELISENKPDILETKLETSPQPSKEISTNSNENITISNENITNPNEIDLLHTQQNTFSHPAKEVSGSLDGDITISKDIGISLEVIEFVKTALEVFFNNYYVSCDLMEFCDHPNLMIAPNENRTQLIVHNTQQNNSKMYLCSNKYTKEIIFIFLTFEEINYIRKYFITSPSQLTSTYQMSKTNPCASVEITDALIETPIAVAKLLRHIQTREYVGLCGGSFTWIMTGTEECFNVKQGKTNILWSYTLDDNNTLKMDYVFRLNSIFDFKIVRELTPKQFKMISIALDRILTDFRVHLYNYNGQSGILGTKNTLLKTAVLELEKNPSFKLVPSYTGMDYGVFPTNYNTFICINEEDESLVKFLFQWYTSGRYYITSPFHPKSMTVNSKIPCASPVDITDALKQDNLADALLCLTTKEDEHVFTSNIFNWYMDESEGSFVVSCQKKETEDNLHWTVCEGEGNIQLRYKESSKLRIKLIDLA